MSGANNNAYAESRRMILGVGDIYLDGVFVGNLKGKVELQVKREFAYQRAGNNIADQKAEATSEEVTIQADICDLKVSQLRKAFGVTQAIDIATSKNVQKREVVKVVASGSAVTLGETPVVDASHPFKVYSLDRKTTYASGTDYSRSGAMFTWISGGTITAGAYVAVEYTFADAGANSIAFGGETLTPPTYRMDYVVRDDTGKAWQISFFRAIADTDFKLTLEDRESGNYAMHNITFKALVDVTKPEGQNLFEIVQEDAAV